MKKQYLFPQTQIVDLRGTSMMIPMAPGSGGGWTPPLEPAPARKVAYSPCR